MQWLLERAHGTGMGSLDTRGPAESLIAAARAAPSHAPRASVMAEDEEACTCGLIAQRATPPGTAKPGGALGYGDLIAAARASAPRAPDATGIPAPVRAKMEGALGADFSDVRVHPESAQAVELRALAFTQGSDIHVAPGQWAPETMSGQKLLGHELGHVLQQRAGRVQATAQLNGVGLNDEPALEADADVMGARAARGDAAQERTPLAQAHSGAVPEGAGAAGARLDRLYLEPHSSPPAQLVNRKRSVGYGAAGGKDLPASAVHLRPLMQLGQEAYLNAQSRMIGAPGHGTVQRVKLSSGIDTDTIKKEGGIDMLEEWVEEPEKAQFHGKDPKLTNKDLLNICAVLAEELTPQRLLDLANNINSDGKRGEEAKTLEEAAERKGGSSTRVYQGGKIPDDEYSEHEFSYTVQELAGLDQEATVENKFYHFRNDGKGCLDFEKPKDTKTKVATPVTIERR